MNRIEKLARDHAGLSPKDERVIDAYESGFRKARDLVIGYIMRLRASGSTIVMGKVHEKPVWSAGDIDKMVGHLMCLGDEEVKGTQASGPPGDPL